MSERSSGDGWMCSICGTYVWSGQTHVCPMRLQLFPQQQTYSMPPEQLLPVLTRIADALDRIVKHYDDNIARQLAEKDDIEKRMKATSGD